MPKFRAWKISREHWMSYFIWLYVVRRTSCAHTTTKLQIVLNTPLPPTKKKNQATPKKYLPRIKIQKNPSIDIFPVTWNPEYPPLGKFSKAERFLKKLYIKTLFTWSGGPLSSGVVFFCFESLRAWKQKKPTPLDRGPPLYVNVNRP